jgi:hypothetical protein
MNANDVKSRQGYQKKGGGGEDGEMRRGWVFGRNEADLGVGGGGRQEAEGRRQNGAAALVF